MSYQKLLRILTTGSTLVLVALWGISLRTYYSAAFSSPAGGIAVDLHHATVGLFHFPEPESWSQTIQSIPDVESVTDPDDGSAPLGKFNMGVFRKLVPPGGPPDRYVRFPVWFPYLVVLGGLLVFARVMRRRQGAGTERELATARASAAVDRD